VPGSPPSLHPSRRRGRVDATTDCHDNVIVFAILA